MDKLDRLIKKAYKEDSIHKHIPSQTEEKINKTLNSLKDNHCYPFKLKLATICTLILISSSMIVFANENIKNWLLDIFNYNYMKEKGLQTAVDYGYIQNTNMDYIQCNNTKFKIDYVTMDDSTLALNFNFLLNQNAEGFEGLSFFDMKIYDDKNELIYSEEERYPNDGIALGIGISKPIFISENNVVQSFLIQSDRFPKTKTLRLVFNKMTLYNVNQGNPIVKDIYGDFDITIPLEEKFYNRKTIEYKISNLTENETLDLKIDRAFLTDTSFNLILEDNSISTFDIEIKNKNGDIIYSDENIAFREVNDDTHRKIGRIDISKYDCYDDNLSIELKGKKIINQNYNNIFLTDGTIDNNGMIVYNIKDLESNSNESKQLYETVGMWKYNLLTIAND